MIELTIPGRGTVQLEHLVCDVNGTLAVDGKLIEGVAQALRGLRDRLTLHLVTADTHGKQAIIDQQLDLTAVRLSPGMNPGKRPPLCAGLAPRALWLWARARTTPAC